MADQSDEKKLDQAKVKAISAGLKKLFDQYKSAAKGGGDSCADEFDDLMDAYNEEGLARVAVVVAGGSGAGNVVIVPLVLTWIAKLQKVRQCEQALFRCLSSQNDARKSESEKRLKQLNDFYAQLVKEKDKIKK